MEKEFWKSKKWWAAILGPVVAFIAAYIAPKIGMSEDAIVGMVTAIMGLFGVYIGAQAYTDSKTRTADIFAKAGVAVPVVDSQKKTE